MISIKTVITKPELKIVFGSLPFVKKIQINFNILRSISRNDTNQNTFGIAIPKPPNINPIPKSENIDYSFIDCSELNFSGHADSHSDTPHICTKLQ